MTDKQQRIQHEQQIVEQMIKLYCKRNHHQDLCKECRELRDYAFKRINYCPHILTKTFCSTCPTPCYSLEKKQKIREVMRYSGSRMLLHNPLLVLKHGFYSIKLRLQTKKSS